MRLWPWVSSVFWLFIQTFGKVDASLIRLNLRTAINDGSDWLSIINGGIELMNRNWTHHDPLADTTLLAVTSGRAPDWQHHQPLARSPADLNVFGLVYKTPHHGQVSLSTTLDENFNTVWDWPPTPILHPEEFILPPLQWPPVKDIFTVDQLAKHQGFTSRYEFVLYSMAEQPALEITLPFYHFVRPGAAWDVVASTGQAFVSQNFDLGRGNGTSANMLRETVAKGRAEAQK